MEQVTPSLEFAPERSYKRKGLKIKCFNVLKNDGHHHEDLTLSELPLFEIDVLTEKAAVMLMEDLYYGEYTGA